MPLDADQWCNGVGPIDIRCLLVGWQVRDLIKPARPKPAGGWVVEEEVGGDRGGKTAADDM